MGTMNALAVLFVQAREADEFEREEILQDASQFIGFAVEGSQVWMLTPKGRVFAEADKEHKVVHFDFYPKDRFDRIRFWMNTSSVKFLSDLLHSHPERRIKSGEAILSMY